MSSSKQGQPNAVVHSTSNLYPSKEYLKSSRFSSPHEAVDGIWLQATSAHFYSIRSFSILQTKTSWYDFLYWFEMFKNHLVFSYPQEITLNIKLVISF